MELTIGRPDDWHLHVRDGDALRTVVPHTARQFGRAIIMPNLKPPVTTVQQALAYRERILAAVPGGVDFTPLMTLYLTDNTTPAEVIDAKNSGYIYAVKLYPAGATTHSDSGVTDITFSGPDGTYEKTGQFPIEDIFSDKVFLAYSVDDSVLPKKHGFPLRVVAEDYYGGDWVKYVYKVTANKS